MLPILIPLLAAGAAAATGAWLANRATLARKVEQPPAPAPSEVATEPPELPPPPEPPSFWAFAARWFRVSAKDAAVVPAQPEPTSAPASRPGLAGRIVSPSSVTVFLGLLFAVTCLVSPLPVSIAGWSLDLMAAARMVLLSAAVGIGTNYLAIKMLFFPTRPLPVLHWQGVIPKRKRQIVDNLARGIREHLLSADTIRQAIHDSGLVHGIIDRVLESGRALVTNPDFRTEARDLIDGMVRAFVDNSRFRSRVFAEIEKLARKAPTSLLGFLKHGWLSAVRTRVEEWVAEKVRDNRDQIMSFLDHKLAGVVQEMCDSIDTKLLSLPEKIEERRERLETFLGKLVADNVGKIDIEAVIRQKMEEMDEGELEALIQRTTNHELAAIQYLGAVLGALAGLILVAVETLL